MEIVTNKIVADKLSAYLHHELDIVDLVDWAENVMMDGDFAEDNYADLRDIVSRLGTADVKQFGLTWVDCEQFLNRIGYVVKIEAATC